jgi:hypothetical protein
VAWAVENGITCGISRNAFDPTGLVTREQMVTFLYRYMKLTDADLSATGDLSAFTDAADVSGWAVEAFIWAVENDIICGMDEGVLAPDSNSTRAQIASVLMRMGN